MNAFEKNVTANLRRLRPFLAALSVTFVAVTLQASPISKPHLYRVTYGSVQSFLFGTLHVGVTTADLPPAVIDSLSRTDRAYFELNLKACKNLLADSNVLEFRRKIDEAAQTLPMNSDREKDLYLKLRHQDVPEALSKVLAADKYRDVTYTARELRYFPYTYIGKTMIDCEITVALHQRKGHMYPIRQIETEDQLNFANGEEAKALSDETASASPETTVQSWLSETPGLFKYMTALIEKYVNGAETPESSYNFSSSDLSVSIRNKAWLDLIGPDLKRHPTAIVVGYSHLYGSHGLLAGLRERGFVVERIGQ